MSVCASSDMCSLTPHLFPLRVGELRQLVSLQVLDLRHNKLKSVPTVVYEMVSLQTCYLSFNKITAVSAAIGNLSVSSFVPYCVVTKEREMVVFSVLARSLAGLQYNKF